MLLADMPVSEVTCILWTGNNRPISASTTGLKCWEACRRSECGTSIEAKRRSASVESCSHSYASLFTGGILAIKLEMILYDAE